MAHDPDRMVELLAEADRAREKDLAELESAGFGEPLRDILAAIPDPATDGKGHG